MKIVFSYFAKFLILFVVYILTCNLSLWIQMSTGMGTQIWPAAGIALAAVLIWGKSIFPAIFLGTLAVHWINGDSVLTFIGPAIGNPLSRSLVL